MAYMIKKSRIEINVMLKRIVRSGKAFLYSIRKDHKSDNVSSNSIIYSLLSVEILEVSKILRYKNHTSSLNILL